MRAENSKGIGLPSPISEFVTTKASSSASAEERYQFLQAVDLDAVRQKLASEQLIKLQEVKPINSTAILLIWKRQRKVDENISNKNIIFNIFQEPLVQGYYIKWRGPPLLPDHTWVNVSDADTDSFVINGLNPFTSYEFFIIPYHESIQGMPSNSLDGKTLESSMCGYFNVKIKQ